MNLMKTSMSVILLLATAGCGSQQGAGEGEGQLSGAIRADGSSTVYPITEIVAEEFSNLHPQVRVTVGKSGTGGGFKKFDVGETDINSASRPITPSELETATSNGIQILELPVAYDGLSVIVNPANDWVDHLTVAELKSIWEPNSTVNNWKDVRAGFPDIPLKLYGPGADSGTFDYFTEAVMGASRAHRSDYSASEDDNTLVQGVAGDKGAIGYFGFAYYEENRDKLKIVPIDGGEGPVEPTPDTIRTGKYAPLSRPVFIYASSKSLEKPEVVAFLEFYIENAGTLSRKVGYIPLPDEAYALAKKRLADRRFGSAFSGKHTVGVSITDLLAAEQ